MADVVRDAGIGRLKASTAVTHSRLSRESYIDRSIFRGLRYPAVAAVQIGRGCRYACDFCSIHAFYGSRVRHRPVAEVAAEIESTGRRNVLIVDDNIFNDRERRWTLFRALIPLRVRWGCQVSIDITDDTALLDLMARSGCMAALVGFESLDADNLRQMNKAWTLRHQNARTAIRSFHDRGIMVYGSFIFGYDRDTPDTIKRTVEFAVDARVFLANISPLTPTPGSRLYQRLQREGRLLYDRWWLDSGYSYGDITYRPSHFTLEELRDCCRDARAAFYGYGSIARRLSNLRVNARTPSHLGLFVSANVISRREITAKLGRRLGAPDDPLNSPA